MIIRSATHNDLEVIKNLNNIAFSQNSQYDSDAVIDFAYTPTGEEYFKSALQNKEGVFLVAEEDEEMIGYINGSSADFQYRRSRYFEIENLGVIPDDRRKGMGKKLMQEFTKIVKEKGFEKMNLNCYIKSSEAISFYKS